MKNMKINRIRGWLAAAITATGLLPTVWAAPLQILNLATNEQIRAVAISPDGTTLAISSYALVREQPNSGSFQVESGIELWNVAAGRQLNRLHQRPWRQFDGTNSGAYEAGAMEFSPDGKLLAATDGQGVVLWDITSGTEKFRWRSGVADAELSPGWSADGQRLALPSMAQAGDDSATNGIALIDIATGQRSAFFPVDAGYARVARISPDGKLVATAGQDCTVRVFDLAARTNLFEEDTRGNLFAEAFSPDGRLLVAGDFLIYQVGLENGKTTIVKQAAANLRTGEQVERVEFTPDGRNALSSSALANLRIWDTENWTMVAVVPGCSGRLWPDGTKVALWRSAKPYAIEIWKLAEFIETFRGGQSPQEALVQIIEQNRAPMAAAIATRNECINNLHRIDLAKQIWAADNGRQSTDTPAWSELLPYFGPNVPKCPSGGTYTVGASGEKPQCSVAEHRLP